MPEVRRRPGEGRCDGFRLRPWLLFDRVRVVLVPLSLAVLVLSGLPLVLLDLVAIAVFIRLLFLVLQGRLE